MARGPAGQKLTKEARHAAFGSICAEVDAACCHPRLLVRRLKWCELWELHKFPMLDCFTNNYKSWRQCLANYMETSVDKAKTESIRVFYGGKPSVQIPFLLKLCSLDRERSNPEFSRLSALLSFDAVVDGF